MDRLTTEDYFRAAFVILGEQGSDGLTIAALCRSLEVTKGSFYHHFGGMPGFTSTLLAFWEREHSDRLIAISKAQPEPSLRITLLTELAVGLPHAPEAAIRAWGRSNAEVAEVTARVDRRRDRHITDAIVALGLDRPQARLLARMSLNLLIGAQQREHPVDLKRLRLQFEELTKLIFVAADPELVARLLAHSPPYSRSTVATRTR